MIVHNVVKGKRYISWSGDVTITCPESGYTATLSPKDKSRVNVISGFIAHFDDLDKKYIILGNVFHDLTFRCRLWEIDGVCGEKSYISKPGDESSKKLLFDAEAMKLPYVYYLPVPMWFLSYLQCTWLYSHDLIA